MPKPIVRVDSDVMLRKMREYKRITGKAVAETVKREARLLCVELGRQTQPFGYGQDARDSGEGAVAVGLGGLFFSVDSVNNRTRNLVDLAEAKQFHKANKRRGRAVRLSPRDRKTMLRAQANKLRKDLQKRVGWAKSGWATCAQNVGAAVGNATRGIPAWVKRHAGKSPGSVKDMTRDKRNPRVVLTNAVEYVSKVLSPSQIRNSTNLQRGKMIRAMSREIRYEAARKARLA